MALKTCENALMTLCQWTSEDSSHYATFCLGQARTTLESVFSQIAIIDRFEDIRNQNIELHRDAPEVGVEADG